MTIKKIECHTIEEHTKAIADYLPGGKLWTAKNISDTSMRNLLVGLSRESLRAEGYLKALQEQFIPDNTENFIEDWERALGIPDDCFDTDGTIDERRRNILVKLASLGVQTVSDFENLALTFGITVTVTPGFDIEGATGRFKIYVQFAPIDGFALEFGIIFGDPAAAILECLFNKLKPANCEVIFTSI